jgi:predicted nuclease with TOPRIM domain
MQDEHANALSQLKTETLETEASLREQELKVEVLRRDKNMLLDELNKSKDNQSSIIKLWEGKLTIFIKDKLIHMENQHHSQLMALQDLKEKESFEKIRKLNERLRNLESEKSCVEEEFDSYKSKACAEKRLALDKLAETELMIRKQEKEKRGDLESKVSQLSKDRDQISSELAIIKSQHSQSLKENEKISQRMSDISDKLAEYKAREAHHLSNKAELESKMSQLSNQIQNMTLEIQRLTSANKSIESDNSRIQSEARELMQKIAAKDSLISRLRESMDHADDDYMLQVRREKLLIVD